jgi:16S rRNA G527 N7-methylase RsmG
MVESRARKSVFLREAARVVALPQASVVTARFEDLLLSDKHREAYDVLTVRAVRVDARELEQLQEFLKPSGALFLFATIPAGAERARSDVLSRRVQLTEASDLEIVTRDS